VVQLVMAMKNDGFMPDRFTYNALIRGFGNANQMRRAEVWLKASRRLVKDVARFW
jgi:pentatricopeptide repeat protein